MRNLLFSILILGSQSLFAAEINGVVTGLSIESDQDVLVRLGDNENGCLNDQYWSIKYNVTDPAGKSWLAMLLSAKSRGQTIHVLTDACKIVSMWEN